MVRLGNVMLRGCLLGWCLAGTISPAVVAQEAAPQPPGDAPAESPVEAPDSYREGLTARLAARAAELAEQIQTLQKDVDKSERRFARLKRGDRSKPASRGYRQTQAALGALHAERLGLRAEAGLVWLAAHQGADGRWRANEFDLECGKLGEEICSGRGHLLNDVGVTGLALLAFLRQGHTPASGPWTEAVRRGLDSLLDDQADDGSLGPVTNHLTASYGHFIATLALVEAAAATDDPRHRTAALAGLDYALEQREPGGAWRYFTKLHADMIAHPYDTSVTGWALQLLTSAAAAGLERPGASTALEDAISFIEAMTDPGTGVTGYHELGGASARLAGFDVFWLREQTAAMTAVALLCRQLVDPEHERWEAEATISKSTQRLLELPPVFSPQSDLAGRVDYYYWYYGTRALARGADDEAWYDWLRALQQACEGHGLLSGEAHGSWDPQRGPWGSLGGRVYSTAIMSMAAAAAAARQ